MENASKALLMAGGVLIGVLILALMVTLFASARSLSSGYEATKQSESVQQFNANFTKYVGQDFTMHQAVTICNFSKQENNKVKDVEVNENGYVIDVEQISKDIELANIKYNNSNYEGKVKIEVIYNIQVEAYDDNGYISKIKFLNRKYKITKYDENEVEYKSI